MAAYTKEFMHKGAGGAGSTPRYGNFTTFATSNVAKAIDTLWATPVYIPVACTLTKIGMNVQGAGGAGNKAQAALYYNASDTVLYPSTIVAGTPSSQNDGTATGFTETTISVSIDAGLYWVVYWNGGGTLNTMVCTATTAALPILGFNASQVGITGISHALTFAATMPSTFPSSAPSYVTTAIPLITFLPT